MTKQIIILERLGEPSDLRYNYALWAVVPPGREDAYVNINAISAYKGAQPEEMQALRDGQVVERTGVATYPVGTSTADIEADLIRLFTEFQAHINLVNPTQLYGTFFDGISWTPVGTP